MNVRPWIEPPSAVDMSPVPINIENDSTLRQDAMALNGVIDNFNLLLNQVGLMQQEINALIEAGSGGGGGGGGYGGGFVTNDQLAHWAGSMNLVEAGNFSCPSLDTGLLAANDIFTGNATIDNCYTGNTAANLLLASSAVIDGCQTTNTSAVNLSSWNAQFGNLAASNFTVDSFSCGVLDTLQIEATGDFYISTPNTSNAIVPKVEITSSGNGSVTLSKDCGQLWLDGDEMGILFGIYQDAAIGWSNGALYADTGTNPFIASGPFKADGYYTANNNEGKTATVSGISYENGLYIGGDSFEGSNTANFEGSTNIHTLGEITQGIWHATPIEDDYIESAGNWNEKLDDAPDDESYYVRHASNWAELSAETIGLGEVENTALSTWNGSTELTTLGTVTAGTWEAAEIADAYIASAATWNSRIGDAPVDSHTYARHAGNWAMVQVPSTLGTANQFLSISGNGAALEWKTLQSTTNSSQQGSQTAVYFGAGTASIGLAYNIYTGGGVFCYGMESSAWTVPQDSTTALTIYGSAAAGYPVQLVFDTVNKKATFAGTVVAASWQTSGIQAAADGTTAVVISTHASNSPMMTFDSTNGQVVTSYALKCGKVGTGNIQAQQDGTAAIVVYSAGMVPQMSFDTINTKAQFAGSVQCGSGGFVAYDGSAGISASVDNKVYVNGLLTYNGGPAGSSVPDPLSLNEVQANYFTGTLSGSLVLRPTTDGGSAIRLVNASNSLACLSVDTVNGIVSPNRLVLRQY